MTDKVAIVGAGLVGRSWAITFARGGHRVMIFDADDKAVASALSTVEGMLRTPRQNLAERQGWHDLANHIAEADNDLGT